MGLVALSNAIVEKPHGVDGHHYKVRITALGKGNLPYNVKKRKT